VEDPTDLTDLHFGACALWQIWFAPAIDGCKDDDDGFLCTSSEYYLFLLYPSIPTLNLL